MKIGLVTGEFPPMQGGVGAFTLELARVLAPAGHEIHVITSRTARPTSNRPGIFDIREPIKTEWGYLHPRARHWRWGDVGTIADIALRFDLDVVNIQYQAAAYNMRWPAINFAPGRLRGLTKTVVTFHDLRVPFLFPKAGGLRKRVVYQLAKLSDGVIVTNGEDKDELGRLNYEVPLRQIPIGSNITVYSGIGDRGSGIGHAIRLAYFGFLNESKGADTLIQALAQLDESFELVFIGGRTGASDPENNAVFFAKLDGLIEELGVSGRVTWTGFLPDEQVSAQLHSADIIVMPYRDGVSLRRGTLMAALAHARPVISTLPTKPIPELIHDENIWLVPRDDSDALSNAISHLAQNPGLRTELGLGAGVLAQSFTWDGIAKQTTAFFEQVIK